MAIPPLVYPEFRPYSNVQPFTVRDGATYLLVLEGMRKWMRDDLTPHLNTEMSELVETWQSTTMALVDSVNTQLESQDDALTDQLNEQNTTISEALANQIVAFDDVLQQVISNSIELQDDVLQGIFNDPDSEYRELLGTLYAPKTVENDVESLQELTGNAGRLGAANLAETFLPVGNLSEGVAEGSSSIFGSGATSPALNLVGRMQTLLGITINNQGQGGELVTHHAARAGAVPALVTIANGTIPASGFVNIVVENFTSGRLDRIRSFTGKLHGVQGTISYSGGSLRFTRAVNGAQVRVPDRVPFMVDADVYRGRFTLLWPGKNTLVDPPHDAAQVIEYTRRMVQNASTRTIVLGHFVDRDENNASIIAAIHAVNAQYAIDYGERYIDIQRFLTSNFLWYVTGITPTPADIAAQQAGKKPPSVSSDTYHLNDAGYYAVHWITGFHLKALGWYADIVLPPMPTEPTIPSLPPQVAGLQLTRGNAQATAIWNVTPLATSYTLEYRTGSGAWTVVTGITGTTHTVTGLVNGTTYEFRVKAASADGDGIYSTVQTIIPAIPVFGVFTSDGFTGVSDNVVGRATDSSLGGSAKTWESSTTLAAAQAIGSQMVRGGSTAAQFVAFKSPSARQRVEAKIVTLPSVESFLVARRQALASSDQYRLRIHPTGVAQLQTVIGGTTANVGAAFSCSPGDILGIEVNGDTITARQNGSVVETVTNDAIAVSGYAGIAVATNAAFTFDDFVLSALF